MTTHGPRLRPRRRVSAVAMVVFTITLFVALVAGWAHQTLFDSHEFAVRATATLSSPEVRKALADQITDELIVQGDPSLAAYRSVLVGVVSDLMDTDAFRSGFRTAVEEVHHTVERRHANKALLQLSASLSDLTGSTEDASPGLSQSLPADLSNVLIDVTPVVDRIDPYRLGQHVEAVAIGAAILCALSAGVAIAFARRRRRSLMWLGLAAVVAAIGVLALAAAIPNIAADEVSTFALIAPVRDAVTRFVADLGSLAVGVIALGVLLAAAATATAPPHVVDDSRRIGPRLAQAVNGELGRRYQAAAGIALALLGAIVFFDSSAAIAIALAVGGALLGYVGLVSLFGAILGDDAAVPRPDQPDLARVEWSPKLVVMGVLAALLAVAISLIALLGLVHTRDQFAAAGEQRCNGSTSLCDRRLDQVAFAGTHNSMSSSSDPGWLFAEQLTGIPAQLRAGVRALLVKTHYGIPTGVQVNGAELVVTDEADETSVNRAEEIAELGPEAVARATELQKTTPPTASGRDIYLCHVYCELGATRLSAALHDIRRFIDANPDEVVMLFAGDYVSAADTAEAFERAGLTDHLWTYDTSKPPPTLRDMISAKRTLLVLSEHSGPPPSWYTTGYGIFQDTPYTFAAPADFNCDVNRGPADAPLFELNHFITNAKPPSAEEARQVNSAAALEARVQACKEQRGLSPTIIAVDFATVGDLIGVVDRLNDS